MQWIILKNVDFLWKLDIIETNKALNYNIFCILDKGKVVWGVLSGGGKYGNEEHFEEC